MTGCDIYKNSLSGVQTKDLGNPLVTNCTIRDGCATGVGIYEKGRGRFVKCEIRANKLAGIAVRERGKVIVDDCRIVDTLVGPSGRLGITGSFGVLVYEEGTGIFTRCVVDGNQTQDWNIRDCNVEIVES